MDLETAGHVLKGVPADVIQSFVVGAGSDLLIIGSHSKRGPLDIGMGSTSAAVTKSSPCSVLMVWPTKEEAERVKKLMIPAYPFVFPYG